MLDLYQLAEIGMSRNRVIQKVQLGRSLELWLYDFPNAFVTLVIPSTYYYYYYYYHCYYYYCYYYYYYFGWVIQTWSGKSDVIHWYHDSNGKWLGKINFRVSFRIGWPFQNKILIMSSRKLTEINISVE